VEKKATQDNRILMTINHRFTDISPFFYLELLYLQFFCFAIPSDFFGFLRIFFNSFKIFMTAFILQILAQFLLLRFPL